MDNPNLAHDSKPSVTQANWIMPLILVVSTAACWLVGCHFVMKARADLLAATYRPGVADLPATQSKFAAAFELEHLPGLSWTADLPAALEWARRQNANVFLEIDGVTDCNGALNHCQVFARYEVRSELKNYVRVLLYVDFLLNRFYAEPRPEEERFADAEDNRKFQAGRFQTCQTPWYAILRLIEHGDFEVVAVYDEGLIRDVPQFIAFLRNAATR